MQRWPTRQVACMSVLTSNYYTKINPRAILPNSVQKSLGKPGYVMEQNPAVGRYSTDVQRSWALAPVASQTHQPRPTEEACFTLGSASGWRGQQGTRVQSLGTAPPPHPHHKAAAHFFRWQTRNHLLRLTPQSSHFYLERKSLSGKEESSVSLSHFIGQAAFWP